MDIIKVSVRSRMVVAVKNKFELLVILIVANIDVVMTSKAKINESFPYSQFLIAGFLFTEVEKHMDRSSRL